MAKRSRKASTGVEEIPLEDLPDGTEHLPEGDALTALADVLGHDRPRDILERALTGERMHHAWIFAGPKGVGKRTTAEAFAAMALDPNLGTDLMGNLAADEGSVTADMARRRVHPDLHFVNKELTPFASDARVRTQKQRTIPLSILKEYAIGPANAAPRSPASAGARARKVIIIDEAEFMAIPVGQNTMLKTLEEPPAGTILILIAEREDRLLPTIRSRCTRVAFTPLSDDDMQRWMQRAEIDATGAEREWLLWFAQGAPGIAKLAADTNLYDWHIELDPMLSGAEPGGGGRGMSTAGFTMAQLVDTWAAERVKNHKFASKEAANALAVGLMCRYIAERGRSAMRRSTALAAWGASAVECAAAAERTAASNVALPYVFEQLVARLARLERDPEHPAVLAELASLSI